jgi:hypothetical protein
MRAIECVRGARRAEDGFGVAPGAGLPKDAVEQARSILTAPAFEVERAKRQRGFAVRLARDCRLEQRLRVVVLPIANRNLRENGRCERILTWTLLRQRFRLCRLSVRNRGTRRPEETLCSSRSSVLIGVRGRKRRPRTHIKKDDDQWPHRHCETPAAERSRHVARL